MHLAVAVQASKLLLPSLDKMISATRSKMAEFEGIIKIGRTHTQVKPDIRIIDTNLYESALAVLKVKQTD